MTGVAAAHEEDALGRAYDGRLMRRLLGYARPYWKLVVAAVVLLLIDGLLQLVGPLLTRIVIDEALPARDFTLVWRSTAIFGASLVAQFACTYGETMLTSLLGQRVMRDLREQLFAHLQRLPVSFFDTNPVGRLVTRVTSDVESLNELFTAGVVAGLGDLFTLLAIGVLMVVTDWRLALAAFAVIPLIWLTSALFQRHVRNAYREIRTRLARINAFLQERITGMRVVQLFGREGTERAKFRELNDAHLDAHIRSIRVYAVYFPVIEVLTSVALAAILVAGTSGLHAGTLTVGTVAAFIQLSRRFYQPLQDLADKYNTLQQAMASSERIFKLLDEQPEQRVIAGAARAPAAGRGAVTVTFEDVWFTYGDASAERPSWVLRGVSFTARPGGTLALVGHTGAGKTTIISLLMRFYDAQRGRILVDGVDVRDLTVEEVRALVGYVQQDIFLFAGSVADNIRLSSPLDEEEIERAAARVGADRFVRNLPGGYAYELGERGASVSVGERQLLSFARAIAADPAVLLLDEATSAVDSEREAEIQLALATLMAGRTTIAVAHRLSTVVAAQEILVLHHGAVVERGTHRELLAARGLYNHLFQLQVGAVARESKALASPTSGS